MLPFLVAFLLNLSPRSLSLVLYFLFPFLGSSGPQNFMCNTQLIRKTISVRWNCFDILLTYHTWEALALCDVSPSHSTKLYTYTGPTSPSVCRIMPDAAAARLTVLRSLVWPGLKSNLLWSGLCCLPPGRQRCVATVQRHSFYPCMLVFFQITGLAAYSFGRVELGSLLCTLDQSPSNRILWWEDFIKCPSCKLTVYGWSRHCIGDFYQSKELQWFWACVQFFIIYCQPTNIVQSQTLNCRM